MAKKSAVSKGYRKNNGKKPYLSKRDIITLCILIVVVAVGAILLFSYDDGALKVKDGAIVDAGDNWLVVNGASNGKRYYKLGEVGEIEGFAREAEAVVSDDNLHTFRYTPEDEGALDYITISANPSKSERIAEYYHNLFNAVNPSEMAEAADGGYTYFTYKNAYHADESAEDSEAPAEDAEASAEDSEAPAEDVEAPVADAEAPAEDAEAPAEDAEAPAEDAEAPAEDTEAPAEDAGDDEAPNRFEQSINAFLPAGSHGTVVISAVCHAPSEDAYLTDEQLNEYVAQALSTIALESGK